MQRRRFLAASVACLAAPHVARAQGSRVLRIVPDADLAILDPTWVTAYQTRDHGFLVYDTLFGQDQVYTPRSHRCWRATPSRRTASRGAWCCVPA